MSRNLLAVALACGLLAGCAVPEDAFSPRPADPAAPAVFTFVAESYDLFPTRRFEGEAVRLQELQQYLASNNLCPDGYDIYSREESTNAGNWFTRHFQGAIFRVTYHGQCRPSAAAGYGAPAGDTAPTYTAPTYTTPGDTAPGHTAPGSTAPDGAGSGYPGSGGSGYTAPTNAPPMDAAPGYDPLPPPTIYPESPPSGGAGSGLSYPDPAYPGSDTYLPPPTG